MSLFSAYQIVVVYSVISRISIQILFYLLQLEFILFNQLNIQDQFEDTIDNIIEYIKNNGGFTISGCYKIDESSDQYNSDKNADKMISGEVGRHIVLTNQQ